MNFSDSVLARSLCLWLVLYCFYHLGTCSFVPTFMGTKMKIQVGPLTFHGESDRRKIFFFFASIIPWS